MNPIEKYLRGIPVGSREQALAQTLKSFWSMHRDRLQVVADKGNPLRDEALVELGEWKQLGSYALAQGFFATNSQGYGYAARLASLNVPVAEVTFRYAARSKKVGGV